MIKLVGIKCHKIVDGFYIITATLILFHPRSGSINIYERLLAHLGDGPTVYGVQAVWEGGVCAHRTMEAMADHYAAEIGPLPGPYVLAGLSLGAQIALQVATRLPRERVRLVVLLDGWGPGYPRFPGVAVRLAIHLRRAWRLPWAERLLYLLLERRIDDSEVPKHARTHMDRRNFRQLKCKRTHHVALFWLGHRPEEQPCLRVMICECL